MNAPSPDAILFAALMECGRARQTEATGVLVLRLAGSVHAVNAALRQASASAARRDAALPALLARAEIAAHHQAEATAALIHHLSPDRAA